MCTVPSRRYSHLPGSLVKGSLRNGTVPVTPRHRALATLVGGALLCVALAALNACGTSPASRAASGPAVAVVDSPAPATTGAVPTAKTSKVFGANARPISLVPKADPRKGLIYRGLTAARTGPCVGGFQIGGTARIRCT